MTNVTFLNEPFLMMCCFKTPFQPELLGSKFAGCPTGFFFHVIEYYIFRYLACSVIAILINRRLIQRLRCTFNET